MSTAKTEFQRLAETFLDPATSREHCRELWGHRLTFPLDEVPFVTAVARTSKWDMPSAERCVRRALECGIGINDRFDRGTSLQPVKATILHDAISSGKVEFVALLLTLGANPFTPFQRTVSNGGAGHSLVQELDSFELLAESDPSNEPIAQMLASWRARRLVEDQLAAATSPVAGH